MTINTKKLLMILVAMSTVVACSKQSEERAGRDTGVGGNVGLGNNTSCSTQASAGRIYDAGNAGGSTFEQRVKGLLSAAVDPQYFGTISGGNGAQNGVTVDGDLRYDGAGNVNLAQSNLTITVYDSYVGQTDSTGKLIQAYPISFTAASAGTMNLQTNTFTLQFKDEYGEVTLNGTITGATATGTVSYQNYRSYNGGQASSGVLGSFTMPTCGFIN